MKKNITLQSILTHLAQEAVRPSEIDLWPILQAKLTTKSNFQHRKEPNLKSISLLSNRKRVAFISALTLLAVLGMIFILPQGWAWAKNFIRFFLPTKDQIAIPTQNSVNLVEITPGVMQPTLTPASSWKPAFAETCGELFAPRCSVEQIQQLVSFQVKSIAVVPAGLQFIGATGGPEGVTLIYQRNDPYSIISLTQSPMLTEENQTVLVGSSAVVEEILINSVDGEYVKGGYFHLGGDTETHWDPSAELQSLRWEENGILYTITLTGSNDFTPQMLDKIGLTNLATSLTDQVTPIANELDVVEMKSISEAEQEAGFEVIEPSWIPEGYLFKYASYIDESKTICLVYFHPSDIAMGSFSNPPTPSLTIAESKKEVLPLPEDLTMQGLDQDQVFLETADVRVGGTRDEKGLYVYGSLDPSKICGIQSFQNQVLMTQLEGLNVSIIAQKEGPIGVNRNWLTQQEMVRLAESITGVSTIDENQLDPEFLTSIEDIRQMAGIPLKFPTKLPEGMNFTYGQVLIEETIRKVILNYSNDNQNITLRLINGSYETLTAALKRNPDAYRQTTIHNQLALISQGYWNDNNWVNLPNGGDGNASVIWIEDEVMYSISGFNAYPSQVWIEIAESVK